MIIDYIKQLNNYQSVQIIIKVLLSVVLGGVIGIERDLNNKTAGFRTYSLVTLGSTLIMLTNLELAQEYGGDPSRMGAQVISGIGFLGAGTIITRENKETSGLTTAAALWASAGIGLAVGAGYYLVAIAGTVGIFLLLSKTRTLKKAISDYARVVSIFIVFATEEAYTDFLKHAINKKWIITNVMVPRQIVPALKNKKPLYMKVRLERSDTESSFLKEARALEGVEQVSVV